MLPRPVVEAIEKVEAARAPADVFGLLDVDQVFKTLARLLHPDRCANDPRASAAMAKLSDLRDRAKNPAPPVEVTIRTKRNVYRNVVALAGGDLCDVYQAVREGDGPPRLVAIKLLRHERDRDLMAAEARALDTFWRSPRDGANADTFRKYLPRMVEAVTIKIAGRSRSAHVLGLLEDRVSLADVLRRYPDGIDPRDMAWMWRRIIECLSWTHAQRVVHGALLPEHVLIGTGDHSAQLIDWSYSVQTGERVKAIPVAARDQYPVEVLEKLPATPATDLYMSARIAQRLVGRQPMPARIQQLIDACLIRSPFRRHNSARELYGAFDRVLRDLYGPPKFRPFTMK